jgi:hypothetical protein
MLSHGMTEPEVVGRTGEPERRIDQLDPRPLSRRIASYQYLERPYKHGRNGPPP